MRARDRFEHTEPWGFSPEASGVRTRPDLEREIGAGRATTLKLEELDAPDTEHMSQGTALLAPRPASTLPLARPLRLASGTSVTRGSGAPPVLAAGQPAKAHARPHAAAQDTPLQAALHASVYASVHAALLAASHLPRGAVLPPPDPPAWPVTRT